MAKNKLLFEGNEWDFDKLERTWSAIKSLAVDKYKINLYDNQFEIITAEQMIENYCTHGLPAYYSHWSLGKAFENTWNQYLDNKTHLAYEIIINTDPCICYQMENNSMPLQTLVMAHAAVGHNSFFKNNYMFTDNTQADFILEYCTFADRFINKCAELYGQAEVTMTLDAAHSLADQSMRRKRAEVKKEDITKYKAEWKEYLASQKHDLDVLTNNHARQEKEFKKYLKKLNETAQTPEHDLLYFIEKNSPGLAKWQKEILRIVRVISSYFYPQMLTKMSNEGWASYWEYKLMVDLWDKGLINNECYWEMVGDHVAVVNNWKKSLQVHINPYYLGYNIYADIERMCKDPTPEDYKYFPKIAGKKTQYLDIIKDAAYNYHDADFVSQFLSLPVLRKLKIAMVEDDSNKDYYSVIASSEEKYFEETKQHLASTYHMINSMPDVWIKEIDYDNKTIRLSYDQYKDRGLDRPYEAGTRAHISLLMGKAWKVQF